MRTMPSPMPSAARRSGGSEACVIVAGWLISVSTPPRLSARLITSRRARKRLGEAHAVERAGEAFGGVVAAEIEGDHGAEAARLPLLDLEAGMVGQPRVEHA